MTDRETTLDDIKRTIQKFSDEREWAQFHSPKNLSMALATEAAELMEIFIWPDGEESHKVLEKKRHNVECEAADILAYLALFCARYEIDLAQAFEKKMALNAQKYPLDKATSTWQKYTDL